MLTPGPSRTGRYTASRLRPVSLRGFSLVELIVVMAVTALLASILLPALSNVRNHAERLYSANNMRQIGLSMSMYSTDSLAHLPSSALVRDKDPSMMQEMMAVYIDNDQTQVEITDPSTIKTLRDNRGWEGIGLLHRADYLGTPEIFYCRVHRGDHPFERYANSYSSPSGIIYSNYHYRGDWDRDEYRWITLARDASRVMLTDGMRTKRDFNHRIGYHSLQGDGSVWWRSDLEGQIYNMLPDDETYRADGNGLDLYQRLWDIMDEL